MSALAQTSKIGGSGSLSAAVLSNAAFTNGWTAGNLLFVAVEVHSIGNSTVLTVDAGVVTWTLLHRESVQGMSLETWVGVVSTGGGKIVSATLQGGNGWGNIIVQEWTLMANSSFENKTATVNAATGKPDTGTTGTTEMNVVAIAVFAASALTGNPTWSGPSAGYTIDTSRAYSHLIGGSFSFGESLMIAYNILTSVAAQRCQATITDNAIANGDPFIGRMCVLRTASFYEAQGDSYEF